MLNLAQLFVNCTLKEGSCEGAQGVGAVLKAVLQVQCRPKTNCLLLPPLSSIGGYR